MPEPKRFTTQEAMAMTGLSFKGLIYRRMAAGVKPQKKYIGEVRTNEYTEADIQKLLAYPGARKLPEVIEPPPNIKKLRLGRIKV